MSSRIISSIFLAKAAVLMEATAVVQLSDADIIVVPSGANYNKGCLEFVKMYLLIY